MQTFETCQLDRSLVRSKPLDLGNRAKYPDYWNGTAEFEVLRGTFAMVVLRAYLNPTCARCRRIAGIYRKFDWLRRIEFSTEVSPIGDLVPGQIAVRDERTGTIYEGIDAVRRLMAQVPAFWPIWPFLFLPTFAVRIDRETRGCHDNSCPIS